MGYVAHPCATGTPSASPTSDRYFLNPGARGFASNDGADGQLSQTNPAESGRCHFSVFRADSVSVTSTQFAGGDWRWYLSDQHGAVLVEAGDYHSEAHCREAVAILQARAARATVA